MMHHLDHPPARRGTPPSHDGRASFAREDGRTPRRRRITTARRIGPRAQLCALDSPGALHAGGAPARRSTPGLVFFRERVVGAAGELGARRLGRRGTLCVAGHIASCPISLAECTFGLHIDRGEQGLASHPEVRLVDLVLVRCRCRGVTAFGAEVGPVVGAPGDFREGAPWRGLASTVSRRRRATSRGPGTGFPAIPRTPILYQCECLCYYGKQGSPPACTSVRLRSAGDLT
jgi:hypothetical protein